MKFRMEMRMINHLSTQVFLVLLSALLVRSQKLHYRAAVAEMPRFLDESLSPEEVLKNNLDNYEAVAYQARREAADIIVYPESGLAPVYHPDREFLKDFAEDIPEADGKFNPCLEGLKGTKPQILKKLSCIASRNRLYLVANVADYKNCNFCTNCTCPPDGFFLFNTNVVFDRKGVFIAKYHKRHLYFEPEMNLPPHPKDVYFDTDFGKFTTFVCFDLLSADSVKALEKPGVLNVAFTTYWFDHTPFTYFATAFQQAWAMGNRVNLLAANTQHDWTGSLGSGIYSGSRGALIYTHNPDNRGKLLVTNVLQNPRVFKAIPLNQKRFIIEGSRISEDRGEESRMFNNECTIDFLVDPLPDYICSITSVGDYRFAKLEGESGSLKICHGGVCCHLDYQADSMDENYYLGVTGLGLNLYNVTYFGTQSCFLARCEDVGDQPCANYVLKSQTTFRKANLRANFSTEHVYPYALDSELRLTDRDLYHFNHKHWSIDYKNLHRKSSLIFLGVYGRVYSLDRGV